MKIETYRKAILETDKLEVIGNLRLTTGRIVACDPFFTAQAKPYAIACDAGDYAVRVWRATVDGSVGRIAFCELIVDPMRQVSSLQRCATIDGRTSYSVEFGLSSFMDESVREEFTEFIQGYYENNTEGNYYDDVLSKYFSTVIDGEYVVLSDCVIHRFSEGSPGIAIFQSGLGDGVYSSYAARSANGKLVSFISDFGLTENLGL